MTLVYAHRGASAAEPENTVAAFRAYHLWQVVYWTTLGDVVLPVGYAETTTRPVTPETIEALRARI